ncbi:glycosyl hydrolase family 18 protein [Neobacillus cucumis]|uniref:glycosyl hydrolase family 18 protein n=1 Tax=Neobacillus cucumis TaxID=1740721 RepID=UPI0028534D2B|nr:glycosyl hydrolase family 18 protein [Neobacillus cucumis]MDR4947542.1 glycosyl hydrolase family 18 protein [Neobacillus cucumis]
MNKRFLLLAMVIVLTFLGGIYTGLQFTTNKPQKTVTSGIAPQSAIKPETKELPEVEKTQSKVLMGYIQDFRDPNQVDYSKLTHVIFSFAHPTKDGGLLLNGDTALKNLRTTVANAKKTNTKVELAVGGWYYMNGGESYPYFKAAISSPASRTKLVNNLTNIAVREKLDGIDIDFEHPHSKADADNLAAFTKELSTQLHAKKKELSVAVNAKVNADTLTVSGFVQYNSAMFKDVDHVNIMAYDGQWDGSYNAANLSPYPFTEKIVNYWSQLFDEQKISKEKLVLGVPSYAQPADPNIKQVSYGAIINQNSANASSDTVKMNGTTYYYNGAVMMKKKTKLALDNGFGGMMIWELGLDAKGSNSLTSSISNTIKESINSPVKYYTVVKAN